MVSHRTPQHPEPALTPAGLYNSFLASGAPSELNIDHSLRNRLDSRMIKTNTDEDSMRECLDEVVDLFELAQGAVFKLMASVSVICGSGPSPRLTWMYRTRFPSSFETPDTRPSSESTKLM